MAGVVKSMESAMKSMNLEKVGWKAVVVTLLLKQNLHHFFIFFCSKLLASIL